MMENPLFSLKSVIAAWLRSSPSLVTETVLGILCGALLFLVLEHFLESEPPSPPPRKRRTTGKRSVEPRRRSRCRKKRGALKACRECLQELEKARGLISLLGRHVGRPPEQGGFHHLSCQDPPGEVCKAAPEGAAWPCGEPVEDAAPAMSTSNSPAPLTGCSPPLASTLSPGPTTPSVSIQSHSSLSASQPPEPFLPLDGLSPQPHALSQPPSCAPDSEALPPPPTASSAPPTPDSALTVPQGGSVARPLGTVPQGSSPHAPQSTAPTPPISGLGNSSCPILALSQWHQSHHPPETSFQEDSTDRQVEASSLPFLTSDEQHLLEIHVTKKISVKVLKENEKDALYQKQMNPNYHLNSLGNTWKSPVAEQDTTTPQPFWSMNDRQEQLASPQQLYNQLFWGLPSLHSESLEATAWTSEGSSTLQSPPFLFNGISNACPVQLQPTVSPLLSHSQPMSHLEFPPQPLFPTVLQFQPPPLAQLQTWSHLQPSVPSLPLPSPPQIRACGVSCPTAQNKPQSLIPIEIQHPERPLETQLESRWHLSSVVKRSQEVFRVFTSNHPKDRILPENFPVRSELQKQLEQHLQNWHMQHSWELSPKIQEPLELRQHQGKLPGTCQARGKHGPSQPSSFTGESSKDAQKMGIQLSHNTGKVQKDLSKDSESSLVTIQMVDSEESERDLMLLRRDSRSDLLRNLDKNPENTLKGHLSSELGQMNNILIPMSVHGSWLAVNHSSATADTHVETKNLGILKGWEPCVNTSHRVFFLDTDIQNVLEAHITKFRVKHRWGLPLKVLKPTNLIKLKKAKASHTQQFTLPSSSASVSGAYPTVKFAEFLGNPPEACLGGRVKTEESVPALARPCPGASPVCEEIQSVLGGTPFGDDHGPSKASLTREKGRPPSQSLTLTWQSGTVEWAERGRLDLSPTSAMVCNEPRGKTRGGDSQDPYNRVTMLEVNLGSQSLRARETMEANVSPALQPELGTNVLTKSQNINAHLRSLGAARTSKSSLFPIVSVLQDPEKPCFNKEVVNEVMSIVKVQSKNQPQDCPTDMTLAADNLASQMRHCHTQRMPTGERLASHVLCCLKTALRSSLGKQEPKISNVQDTWKNQRQMIAPTYKREDCRRPDPGEHVEVPENLGTSQISRMSPSARATRTVDSVDRKYFQLRPEKKQGPPESFFRQRMKLFLQGIFPNKTLKGQDALQKYKPKSITAQSQGPVQSRSVTDNTIPEAQTLLRVVGQMLEEKVAIHHGLHTTKLNEQKQEPQAPGCGCFSHHRPPFYPQKGRMMSHTGCSHQANSKDQSCSIREGQVRQKESLKSVRSNDEPLGLSHLPSRTLKKTLSPVSPCQYGPNMPGALGHHQHCPKQCFSQGGVLPGQP